MIPVFNKHIQRLSDNLEKNIGKGSFDLREVILKIGLDQIFGTFFIHYNFLLNVKFDSCQIFWVNFKLVNCFFFGIRQM